MKQNKKNLTLALVLLYMPFVLYAQRPQFPDLRPGSWFEAQVADSPGNPNSESHRYLLKYLVKSIDPNGNKEYKLTFERIRIVLSQFKETTLGYDSYYPQYTQGKGRSVLKPSFSIIADKNGKVIRLKPDGEFSRMHLNEIVVRKQYGGTSVDLPPVNKKTAADISNVILQAIAHRETSWHNGKVYKNSGLSFLLSKASFSLTPNVLIEGKIKNLNQKMKDGFDIYLPGMERNINIANDGSFKLQAFLNEGVGAALTYNYITKEPVKNRNTKQNMNVDTMVNMKALNIPLFVRPGDTVYLVADANRFIETLKFSGNAAQMATFGLESAKLDGEKEAKEIPYGVTSFSAAGFMQSQAADAAKFKRLLKERSRLIPGTISNWYNMKFTFEQANSRLDFLSKTHYRSNSDSKEIFSGFPEHFFSAIDTLPVMMTDYNNEGWYSSFLNSFHLYMINKVGQYNGGSHDFFLGDYILSLNYLRRYPLYKTLADAFESEIGNINWKTAQTLKPYYDDFINNCGDTTLTAGVTEKWEALAKWAPGNKLPLKNIKLAKGDLIDLAQYKGKALSITFNYHYPDEMKRLLNRIKKQDANKVHFLIIQLKVDSFPPSLIADELKKLPQVTYVEVSGDNEDLENTVLLNYFDVKTFVIDEEQRIVEDNIDDSPDRFSQDEVFQKALQTAFAPKSMSKEDKAELIKNIVWSLGSILITSLIFYFVYKAKLSAVKKRESVERQIKALEIKAIRSQMNPHFLFNALNSIQSLINNSQYKEANVYLEKFSLLMRSVLNNSEKSVLNLSDEMKAMILYLELERLRFGFQFNMVIDKDINTDLIEIPGMIIQPLIENAILHGIAQKGSDGVLEILINKTEKYLKIVIIDNGVGLMPEDINKHSGFGLKSIRERLNLLNADGLEGKLEVKNNSDQHVSGVTVLLIIPID